MEEIKPWLNIIFPFTTEIIKVDTRVKNISYKWQWWMANNKNWVTYKPAITVLDQRGLPIEIELSVLYRVIPDYAAEMLAQYWKWYEDKVINPSIRETVRDVIWQYDAESLPSKRWEIAAKIKTELEKKIKKLKFFELVDVQLRNIELPLQIQQKILQVQEAKQEAERQKFMLQKAKVEAETAKARAKWQADAKIEASKWEAESIKVKAQAQAKANIELSKSVTKELIEYKKVEKWNWQLPKYQGSSNWMILQMK